MKYKIIALVVALMSFASVVYADAEINVDNYFYAHANTPGKYYLKDRTGRMTLNGDQTENDAVIEKLTFYASQGLTGESFYLEYPDGSMQQITGSSVVINKLPKPKWVSIVLEKTTYNETFVRVMTSTTTDASYNGGQVNNNWTASPPTKYGDLGKGPDPGTTDPGGGTDPGGSDGGGTQPISFPVQWNDGTRRITWSSVPSGTYEVVITTPGGSKVRVTPGTGVYKVTDDNAGTYKVEAVKMDGTVIATRNVDVPAGSSSGGGSNPGTMNLYYDVASRSLGWTDNPAGIYKWVVTYPDGHTVNLTAATKSLTLDKGTYGTFKVEGQDNSGNVLTSGTAEIDPDGSDPGGTDPGGGSEEEPCPAGCQALKDALECPDFDEYLGKWADMIRSTYPPPPDWDYVASTMRDKIVPAMGQELVNRSPEIARIIADEFQSREKPVSPPPSIPGFTPSVPRVQDTPKVTGDLNSNVPSFTPDYSQDKPFEILDPGKLEFNDNSDQGYKYNTDGSKPPDYKPGGGDPSAADPGYNMQETEEPQPPTYEYSPAASKPAPDYNTEETPEEEPPNYNTGGEHTGDYRNYKYQQEGPQPDYNGK